MTPGGSSGSRRFRRHEAIEVIGMTEQDRETMEDPRDPRTEPAGSHAGSGARDATSAEGVGADSGGPDAERDQSGMGAETPSGTGGWQGGEPAQSETGALGRGETGSLGSGGGTAAQAGAGQSSWEEQSAGQSGGVLGQEGVGGESWEGRDRDIGQGGWNTGDAGFGGTAEDDGGSQSDDPAADPSSVRSNLG